MLWSIADQVATLRMDAWQLSFHLAQPHLGLQVQPARASVPWQLLQVRPTPEHACQIEDSFVRGSDLMVRYGQSETDRFAFQLDFRSVPATALGPFACGLDLWLSVQTQLLDSHPTLEIKSEVPGAIWHATDGEGHSTADETPAALSCQAVEGDVAIFVHPSDQCQAELIGPSGGEQSCLRLFGNFMEKGVIRRGRLRCLLAERRIHAEDMNEAYAQFAASPLPLTT